MGLLSSRLAPLTVSVPAASEWVSFTPVWSGWTTNVTHTGFWRRVGDSIEMLMHATFSGANTQGSIGSLTLPNSLTIDTAKFPTTTNSEKQYVVGTWEGLDTGVNSSFVGVVHYRQDANSYNLSFATGSSTSTPVSTTTNIPFTISNGDTFSIRITLPISGWTSHTASATSANAVVVGGQSVGSKLNIGPTSNQGIALLANNAAIVDSNSTGLTALKFSPTNSVSADANTLDDYEEGTWTPGIAFGGNAVGVTYSATRHGHYTKIGNRVFFNCYFILTSKGSSTGVVSITGLPFTSVSTANGGFSATTFWGGGISRTNVQVTAYVEQNSTRILIEGVPTNADAAGGVSLSDTHVSGTASIMISGHYITAS